MMVQSALPFQGCAPIVNSTIPHDEPRIQHEGSGPLPLTHNSRRRGFAACPAGRERCRSGKAGNPFVNLLRLAESKIARRESVLSLFVSRIE